MPFVCYNKSIINKEYMRIYKLEITEEMQNSSSEGVYGYYSTLERAEKARKELISQFCSVDNLEVFEIEEVELNRKPKLY